MTGTSSSSSEVAESPKAPAKIDSASDDRLLLAFLNMAVAQPVLGVSAHQRVAHAGAVARALPNFGLFVKATRHALNGGDT